MLPAGADQSNQSQTPLGSLQSNLTAEQRIQKWLELVEQNAPVAEIQIAEFEVAEAMKKAPFEIRAQLPFFQQMARKLDATQAFQQFRLPGREQLVADRRDQPEMGKPAEAAKEAVQQAVKEAAKETGRKETEGAEKRAELRLQDGRLVKQPDRSWVNRLGNRLDGGLRGGTDQAAASDRVERMLSAFERMVVARFEGGQKVARESADGKAHFLEKSAAQWRDFFASFMDRTISRKTLLSEIREFLLRGVVQKGSKGVFIGDINFQSGRVEKFVRFSILAEALAKLKAMAPGDAVGKGLLSGMTGEELMYLALAASRAQEFAFAQQAAQGKFMGGRAEAEAAAALGIPLEQQLRQKAKTLQKRRGGGGFGKGLFERDEAPAETPYQFVPWWHWGNLGRPGRFRWVTAVFYTTLAILAIVGIATLTARLLGAL